MRMARRLKLAALGAIAVLFAAGGLIGAGQRSITLADDAGPWTAPARAAKKKNPIAADEKSTLAGKAVYAKECLSCHGEKGKGDGPAAKDLGVKVGDLSDPKMAEQTDGALFWKITEGKKPMASYDKTLSEEDRWNVINYVRTLAPKP